MMRQITLKYAAKALADLLLPRTCIVCGRKLMVDEKIICLFCLSDLPYTRFEKMPHNPMADRFNYRIAGLPGPFSPTAQSCSSENRGREPYAYASALYFYSHDAGYRKIQYQLKYMGNREAGIFFGRMLGEKMALEGHLRDIDAVIPVPLHWTRLLKRGYNQAGVIAREVAVVMNVPLRTDILIRNRRTKTQTKLDPLAKASNVYGAFSVRRGACLCGLKHVLLVDDVFTTGSTLFACFMALREEFPPPLRISIACLGFVG